MSQSDEKNSESTEKEEKIGPGFSLTIAAWFSYKDSKDDKDTKREESQTIKTPPHPDATKEQKAHRIFREKDWLGSFLWIICVFISLFTSLAVVVIAAIVVVIIDECLGIADSYARDALILTTEFFYSAWKIYKAQFHFVKRMQEEYWRNHGQ